MKLFFVLFISFLAISILTWMTLSLEKIQMHRDNNKHVQEVSRQLNH